MLRKYNLSQKLAEKIKVIKPPTDSVGYLGIVEFRSGKNSIVIQAKVREHDMIQLDQETAEVRGDSDFRFGCIKSSEDVRIMCKDEEVKKFLQTIAKYVIDGKDLPSNISEHMSKKFRTVVDTLKVIVELAKEGYPLSTEMVSLYLYKLIQNKKDVTRQIPFIRTLLYKLKRAHFIVATDDSHYDSITNISYNLLSYDNIKSYTKDVLTALPKETDTDSLTLMTLGEVVSDMYCLQGLNYKMSAGEYSKELINKMEKSPYDNPFDTLLTSIRSILVSSEDTDSGLQYKRYELVG